MSKERIVTPKARVCFPKLFTPDKKSNKYMVTLVFEKGTDLEEFKKKIVEASMEHYGKADKSIDLPLRKPSAEKVEQYPVFKDAMVINAKSNFKPVVLNQAKQEVLEASEVYGGCYGRASVSFYPWEYMGKKGIGINIVGLMKVAEGEKLGSIPGAEFNDVEVEEQVELEGQSEGESDDLFS